jgi:hypothetical protein
MNTTGTIGTTGSTGSSNIGADARKDPETLAREIDATRANLGETLDALQAKLSPGEMIDEVMSMFREHGSGITSNLGHAIRENPMPVLLIGAGVAWMIASQRLSSRRREYDSTYAYDPTYELGAAPDMPIGTEPESGEGIRDKADALKEKAREKAHAARERVSGAASSASSRVRGAASRLKSTASHLGESASSMTGSARMRAQRASEGFTRMMDERPLMVGAMGVALGAAIGALIPVSERENELLGDIGDRARERARHMGSEQLDKARERVKEAAESAKQTLVSGGKGGGAGESGGARGSGATEAGSPSSAGSSGSAASGSTSSGSTSSSTGGSAPLTG